MEILFAEFWELLENQWAEEFKRLSCYDEWMLGGDEACPYCGCYGCVCDSDDFEEDGEFW